MKPEERFEVGSSVGKDELGEVFEAKAKDGGARVALKVFEDWTTEKEQSRDAWAKALTQLQQIGPARTPRIEGACVQQSGAWLATRWVDGPSLADVLKQQQLDENMAATIGCGILDALAELHESGEAHGGLTTNKVILTQGFFTGGVIITDPFQHYLYSVTEPVKAEAERYIGLPAYYSPEQAKGEVPDFRSDIYVIGLMLYEMIVGTTPFASPSREMTLRRQMAEPAMAISLAKPGTNVSQDFQDILNLALNKDPGQRFQNPLAMRRALANCRAFGDEEMERNAEPLGVSRGADVASASAIIVAAGAGAAAANVAAEQAAAEQAAAEQAAAEQAAAEQAAAEQAAAEQAAAEKAAAEQAAAEQAAAEQAAAEQAAAEQAAAEQAAAEQAAAEQAAAEQAAAEQAAAEQAAAEQAAAEESSVEVDSSLGATVSESESAQSDADDTQSSESAAAMAADLDYGFDDEQTNSWFAAGFDAGEMEEKHGEPEVPTFTEVKQKSNRVGAVIIALTVIGIVATVFFLSRGAGDDTPQGVEGAQEAAAEGDDSEEQGAADETNGEEADEAAAPADDAAEDDAVDAAEVGEDAGAEADTATEDAAALAEGDAAAADGGGEEAAGEEAAANEQVAAAEEEVAAAAAPAAAAQAEPAAEEAPAAEAPPAEEANDEAADEARAQELLEEGLAAYNSGNNDTARRLLSEAVTLDGGLTRAHRALGDIYFSSRDFSRAARHFRASGAYLELGQAYYRLGEFEDALEAFERAEARGDANAARYIELTRSQLGE